MSNIDKHAVQAVADLKAGYTLGHADVAILNELARIALASLEAEAVGEVVLGEYDDCGCHLDARVACIAADGQADWENFKDGTRLYTAPPAPVSVPAAMNTDDDFDSAFEHGKAVGWNACRAAMLQGADCNSPVIPDSWVACSERMPEFTEDESELYLCWGKYHKEADAGYIPAFLSHKYLEWQPLNDDCDPEKVIITHWRPLPPGPQQEKR